VDAWLGAGLHSLELGRTAAFTVLVLTQLFNCFNARSATRFDMTVLNDLDRFHLAGDMIKRMPSPGFARGICQIVPARLAARSQGLY
jgi:hypothetical protein